MWDAKPFCTKNGYFPNRTHIDDLFVRKSPSFPYRIIVNMAFPPFQCRNFSCIPLNLSIFWRFASLPFLPQGQMNQNDYGFQVSFCFFCKKV